MKEKSLLESKLQESTTSKNELAEKLKEIDSKLSAQKLADLGCCNYFVCPAFPVAYRATIHFITEYRNVNDSFEKS